MLDIFFGSRCDSISFVLVLVGLSAVSFAVDVAALALLDDAGIPRRFSPVALLDMFVVSLLPSGGQSLLGLALELLAVVFLRVSMAWKDSETVL